MMLQDIQIQEHGDIYENQCILFHQSQQSMDRIKNFFDSKYEVMEIIHCAAYKAVGESVSNPIKYYQNNLLSALNILDCLDGVSRFIFSSSACVYGNNKNRKSFRYGKDDEDVGRYIANPYGRTKYFTEEIIKDVARVKPDIQFLILRYFNPIYSHPLLPEDRNSPNLCPQIMKALETKTSLKIFGNDYNTRDGTCIRDYIDVNVLAKQHLDTDTEGNFLIKNLGDGIGKTVLELIAEIEVKMDCKIDYEIVGRRDGDVDEVVSEID